MDINLSSYFEKKEMAKNYIRTILSTEAVGVALLGPPGTGKTNLVHEALEGAKCTHVPGHCTPHHLFNLISRNPDDIIVIDDTADEFKNRDMQTLLKSLTAPTPDGRRIISWQDKAQEVKCKVVLVTNDRKLVSESANAHLQAIKSRMYTYEFELTFQEMRAAIRHVGLGSYDRLGITKEQAETIIGWLEGHVHASCRGFDLRIFSKAVHLYKANPSGWQKLLANQIGVDVDPHFAIIELIIAVAGDSGWTVDQEVEAFAHLCAKRCLPGKRSTYFAKKRRWFAEKCLAEPQRNELEAFKSATKAPAPESPKVQPISGTKNGHGRRRARSRSPINANVTSTN